MSARSRTRTTPAAPRTDAAIRRLLELPADPSLLAGWARRARGARGTPARRASQAKPSEHVPRGPRGQRAGRLGSAPARDDAQLLQELYELIHEHTRVHPAHALQAADHVRQALGRSLRPADRARWTRLRGHALRNVGRAEDAATHYAAAWKAFSALGLRDELGPTAIGWVDALALAGRPDEAARVAARGRRTLPASDRLAHARLSANLGNAHYWAGRLDDANELYRAARRRFLAARRPAEAALCSYNLASALLLQGKARAARPLFVQAEAALGKAGARVLQLQARYGLASVDLVEGRWEQGTRALAALQQELSRRGDERACAAVRRELAGLLAALGAVEAAEPAAREAHAAYARLGLRGEQAHAAFLHARLLTMLDRHHDAQVRLNQAQAHWKRTRNPWALRLTELELARTLLHRGRPQHALRLLLRAQGTLDRRDRAGAGARCRALTAQALLAARRPARAATLAQAAFAQARAYPASLERPWSALTAAQSLQQQGHDDAAVRWAKRAVRALERLHDRLGSRGLRASVAGSRDRLYRGAVEVVLRRGGPRAGRAALDLIATARSAQLIEDLLRRDPRLLRGELRTAIARLRDELLSARDPGVHDVRSRALRGQLEQLESRLAGGPQVPRGLVRKAAATRTVERWAPRLAGRELVLYDRTQDGWRAFRVRDDDGAGTRMAQVAHRTAVDWLPLPDGERALREAWLPLRMLLEAAAHAPRARRRSLLERTVDEATAAVGALREAFWTPLGLQPGSNVVVVPSGMLHGVPLEALPEPAASLEPVVSRLPHPAVLRDDPRRRRTLALLLHGTDPGGRREVDDVRTELQRAGWRTCVGDLRADLQRQREPVGVLHVAAHGSFHREQAMLSGIRLADGWIGFEQLDPKVVGGSLLYFGSCESGLAREGPGAELDGWLAAGLGAGARELVLTLWKLDDEAALAFAREFYPRWLGGVPAPRAASAARAELRRVLPHPFSWAPFAVLG
jgi:tetratricopeptide (TPR) repeat protein